LKFIAKIAPYWGIIYVAAGLIIGLQHYMWHDASHYNNFMIFRASFGHLLAKTNLHSEYPSEYGDIFLYAPPAAVFFAPLYFLPTLPALLLWQLLTGLVVWAAINRLPISESNKQFIAWFCFVEYTISLHNFQTNAWILAFILLTFSYYEQKKGLFAAFFPMAGFFIKGFGGVGGFLLPFYPNFWKNGFIYLFWTIIIGISPCFFVGFSELPRLYSEWWSCLATDHAITYNMMSVMGVLDAFAPNLISHAHTQLIALALLFLFLLFCYLKRENTLHLRLQVLSFLLLWIVLFNHAAESCTYVIAIFGAAIWYKTSPTTRLNTALLLFVLILTSLSTTDFFPKFIRNTYIYPYSLKVIPVFCVWLKLQYQLYFEKIESAAISFEL
jgi:hypothetical protein